MQSLASDRQHPIPRRQHKKSKTGCKTCRIRKVKCDERRPLCVNCERHFRNLVACDFEDGTPLLEFHESARPVQRIGPLSTAQHADEHARPTSNAALDPSRSVGREAEILRLAPAVGAGRIDPFETRPASLQPAHTIDSLISHYLSDFAYRSFPLYANRILVEQWWSFVRNDEVLFHVILLLSSLDRQRLRHQSNALHSRQLLDQCLVLLNNRMQDDSRRTNDQTLAAIAALAAMESERGDIRALDMHIDGLKQVIDIRGGLDAVRTTNPMAANFAFWCAMVCINEPSLLPLTYGDEVSDDEWLYNSETATLLTHDGGQANLREFGVDVVTANVLHKVQHLSRSYTSKLDNETPHQATAVLSNLCSVLEHLFRLSKEPSTDSPIAGLSQSCRLAACLHLFTPQSGYFPDPTLMLHTLVRDLKRSLTQMIRSVGTKSYLLLWLLSVGGIAAHSMPERQWFVGRLVLAIADLQIQSWDVMRQNLVRLAFHDNFCDMSFLALWEEVKAKQDSLYGVSPAI